MDADQNKAEPVALALGSNLGERIEPIRAALKALTPYVTITARSAIYETPPAYVLDQPAFLNAVVLGETKLPPLALLWSIKEIEMRIGRQPTFRYGPRLIDIDLLFQGDHKMDTAELTLPHPRIAEREFVLRPLADIAPEWVYPPTGLTVAAMLAHLPEQTAARTEIVL